MSFNEFMVYVKRVENVAKRLMAPVITMGLSAVIFLLLVYLFVAIIGKL